MSTDAAHIGLARNDGPDTMHQAAADIAPHTPTLRSRVLRVIESAGMFGQTDDEIEEITGLRHQTASARRRELAKAGAIVDSGMRRKTRSGRSAIVWITAGTP